MTLPCNNLNLNLYRVFYIVAKTKSFSESSRVLHISQPAISKHIQNLEFELGTLLFNRTNRGIELTPEAKNLLVYIEKAYNYLSLGEQELLDSKDLTKGKISIGVPTYTSIRYLNKYIKEYMEKYPNISIDITYKSIDELQELLEQHNIDFLILPNHISVPTSLKKTEIGIEKYCLAALNTYLNKDINNIKELSSYKLILPHKTKYGRQKLDEVLSKIDVTLEPIMELENSTMILNYIKEGLGIGYLPESLIENEPSIKKIDLDLDLPRDIINLVYNDKTLTLSSKAFIELLENRTI